MTIENIVHEKLLSHPKLKKVIKRLYQMVAYSFSKKIKSEGRIIKISPDDSNHDYFFGYYDKSPWDATNRYVLCMKASDTSKDVSPNEKLEILLIDTQNNNSVETIAESMAWNVQQGCMAQWLGPKYDREIIYNDYRNGKYCSVILDVFTKKEKIIDMPVYSVSSDGKFALTLDFSRLHRLRPGYGYSNIPDTTQFEKIPSSPCVWNVNLETNVITPLLYYKDFYEFETRKEMANAEHKVNHIMISPNDDKFMIIHRWIAGDKKYSRLITCDILTKNMYNLSDDNMVSHCYWKNNDEIIAFENKKASGNGYYLMKDKTSEYTHLWKHITFDGHPSYSPDRTLVVTDTYPNKERICSLKIMNKEEIITIGRFFSPFKYDNDTRCDLHPRWSRDGKEICIDSCHEGRRALYAVPISNINFATSKIGSKINDNNGSKNKIKIVYLMTACKRRGPTQQTLNIIKNLDSNKFYPILITIYEEEADSRLNEYLEYVNEHYYINTSKKNILMKKTNMLDTKLENINPDIVHTIGLFPDLYVSNLRKYKQITTLRNFVYEDYPTKFGTIKGLVMAKLHLKAIKNITKVMTCSKSLMQIYLEKLNLKFDYIQNGVDLSNIKQMTYEEKNSLRKKYSIDKSDFLYIYTGQFIERKNIPFLLECFSKKYGNMKNVKIILLGDGPLLKELREKYNNNDNIIFTGGVKDVYSFLNISDVYISTSKSEGLPNGVLEAMVAGLPVILSDIPQHKEILEVNNNIGYIYIQDNKEDLINCFDKIHSIDLKLMSNESKACAENYFSASIMSNKYQKEYKKMQDVI